MGAESWGLGWRVDLVEFPIVFVLWNSRDFDCGLFWLELFWLGFILVSRLASLVVVSCFSSASHPPLVSAHVGNSSSSTTGHPASPGSLRKLRTADIKPPAHNTNNRHVHIGASLAAVAAAKLVIQSEISDESSLLNLTN